MGGGSKYVCSLFTKEEYKNSIAQTKFLFASTLTKENYIIS